MATISVSLVIAFLLENTFSRMCEKEADLTAASILDDPTELGRALDSLEKIYREKPRLIDHVSNLFSSHPLTRKRKEYLQKFAEESAF